MTSHCPKCNGVLRWDDICDLAAHCDACEMTFNIDAVKTVFDDESTCEAIEGAENGKPYVGGKPSRCPSCSKRANEIDSLLEPMAAHMKAQR